LSVMPKQSTTRKAKAAQRSGKKASTAAGEFVGDEIHRQKRGSGAASSRKQAIAIGLSKARKAGVRVRRKTAKRKATARKRAAPRKGTTTRRKTAKRRAPSTTRRKVPSTVGRSRKRVRRSSR